jgi:fructose-specific phosphotransferase system IIA component
MKLMESLQLHCVKVPLEAGEKSAAIREMVELLGQAGLIADVEQVYRAVLDREARRSTGIGMGLAVPHAKTSLVKDLVMAVAKPAHPIDFESRDNVPANLIVLLLSPPDQTGPHIQTLAAISRLMMNPHVREAIEKAETAEELHRVITQQEA